MTTPARIYLSNDFRFFDILVCSSTSRCFRLILCILFSRANCFSARFRRRTWESFNLTETKITLFNYIEKHIYLSSFVASISYLRSGEPPFSRFLLLFPFNPATFSLSFVLSAILPGSCEVCISIVFSSIANILSIDVCWRCDEESGGLWPSSSISSAVDVPVTRSSYTLSLFGIVGNGLFITEDTCNDWILGGNGGGISWISSLQPSAIKGTSS